LTVKNTANGLELVSVERANADQDGPLITSTAVPLRAATLYLRAAVVAKGMVSFSYSLDGTSFTRAGETFTAQPGRWIGATIGLYASGAGFQGELGYADYDWFRFDRP
jgi:hypothetical protein